MVGMFLNGIPLTFTGTYHGIELGDSKGQGAC